MCGKNDVDELRISFALHRLEVKHWNDVDFNDGRTVHELYCDDGLFVVGPNRFEGQHGIKAFFEWRREREKRTTRTVITNVIVLSQDARRASMTGILTSYSAKGSAPHEDGNVPALVADFTGDCVLEQNDTWRYASHTLTPVFRGNETLLSLAIDPHFLTAPSSHHTVGR